MSISFNINVTNNFFFCSLAVLTWFDTPGEGSGFDQFVSFSDLQNPAKGFIVNDTLSVQVEFEAVSSTNYYSSSPAQFMSTF